MTHKPIELDSTELELCQNALFALDHEVLELMERQAQRQLGARMTELADASELNKKIRQELNNLANANETSLLAPIPTGYLAMIKSSLLAARKKEAIAVENRSLKTTNFSALASIRELLEEFEALLSDERFINVEPTRIPRLTDFLTIQQAENVLFGSNQVGLGPREFDEKFNILLAPNLIPADINQLRLRCSLRDAPVSVAFVDIDDFKQFNLKYTEPKVDEMVLPNFMSALESHMFERGYAYRQGGDEYLVVCPNLTAGQTGLLFSEFQEKLRELELPGVSEKISVSVGVCTALPECELTDRELVRFASKAKQVAKERGKHRVVGYTGPTYDQEPVDLSVP